MKLNWFYVFFVCCALLTSCRGSSSDSIAGDRSEATEKKVGEIRIDLREAEGRIGKPVRQWSCGELIDVLRQELFEKKIFFCYYMPAGKDEGYLKIKLGNSSLSQTGYHKLTADRSVLTGIEALYLVDEIFDGFSHFYIDRDYLIMAYAEYYAVLPAYLTRFTPLPDEAFASLKGHPGHEDDLF